jgi:DNA-binding MarR family transcriptional regulator
MVKPERGKPIHARQAQEMTPADATVPVHRIPTPLARRFHQICTTVLAEALAGSELMPMQFAVLRHLADEPDLEQNGLAMRLGIDRASTSQLVGQLEAMGVIERRVNGADRRARLLRLTQRGRRLHDRLRPAARAAHAKILAPLSPTDRERLLDLLIQVIKANEVYARPGGGRRKRRTRSSTSTKKMTT